jgi:hypothetical protein
MIPIVQRIGMAAMNPRIIRTTPNKSFVDLDVLAQPLGFVPDLLAGILDVVARPRMPDLGVKVLVSAPVTGRLLKLVRNRLGAGY